MATADAFTTNEIDVLDQAIKSYDVDTQAYWAAVLHN